MVNRTVNSYPKLLKQFLSLTLMSLFFKIPTCLIGLYLNKVTALNSQSDSFWGFQISSYLLGIIFQNVQLSF
jgi:hypothetical protein